MKINKILFYFILLCCSITHADILPQWDIIPAESKIAFKGSQNNAPVTGEFKSFTGAIYADLAQYQRSNITIIVEMNSLSVTYAELATILITPEWFNVKAFPKAEFKSAKFNKINDTIYEAEGTFTIKNKSIPTTLRFTVKETPQKHMVVEGSTVIKRLAFGIGEGEWENTDVIKDDVLVSFKITAARKK